MGAKYGKLKVGDVIFLERFSEGLWIVKSISPRGIAQLSKIQPDGCVINIRRHLNLIDFCYRKTIEI